MIINDTVNYICYENIKYLKKKDLFFITFCELCVKISRKYHRMY